MSERIVDVLESVEIEKQHRDAGLMPQRSGDRLAYAVVEEDSIGQASEEIVLGRIRHLPCHCLSRGDIAENNDGAGDLPATVVDGGHGIFDWSFFAVAPNEVAARRKVHGKVFDHRQLHWI